MNRFHVNFSIILDRAHSKGSNAGSCVMQLGLCLLSGLGLCPVCNFLVYTEQGMGNWISFSLTETENSILYVQLNWNWKLIFFYTPNWTETETDFFFKGLTELNWNWKLKTDSVNWKTESQNHFFNFFANPI